MARQDCRDGEAPFPVGGNTAQYEASHRAISNPGNISRKYGGNMGRSRYSQGYVLLTKSNLWQANWFPYVIDPETGKEYRAHRTRIVGAKAKMQKYQAEKELRKIVEVLQENHGELTTFGWFMNNRWLPMREGEWRPSTKTTNAELLAALEARFGSVPLSSMDCVEMQSWINSIAKTKSRSQVQHLRIFLKSVCAEAVDQDYLAKDPARKLTVPKNCRKVDATVLSWDQLRSIFGMLSQRDQLILMIEATVGLRPSELFALRRRSFTGTQFVITETIYRGKLRDYGKTDGSLTTVDLPAPLAAQLSEWLNTSSAGVSPIDGFLGQESGTIAPDISSNPTGVSERTTVQSLVRPQERGISADSFIFPNSRGGPLLKDNYLNRVLYPLRESLGLKKLNFQVLRRTFATLAQKHGGVKDVQRQLRHSKPDVTAGTYMQAIPESVKSMVEDMYQQMVGSSKVQ